MIRFRYFFHFNFCPCATATVLLSLIWHLIYQTCWNHFGRTLEPLRILFPSLCLSLASVFFNVMDVPNPRNRSRLYLWISPSAAVISPLKFAQPRICIRFPSPIISLLLSQLIAECTYLYYIFYECLFQFHESALLNVEFFCFMYCVFTFFLLPSRHCLICNRFSILIAIFVINKNSIRLPVHTSYYSPLQSLPQPVQRSSCVPNLPKSPAAKCLPPVGISSDFLLLSITMLNFNRAISHRHRLCFFYKHHFSNKLFLLKPCFLYQHRRFLPVLVYPGFFIKILCFTATSVKLLSPGTTWYVEVVVQYTPHYIAQIRKRNILVRDPWYHVGSDRALN